jgi:hypothetical protein
VGEQQEQTGDQIDVDDCVGRLEAASPSAIRERAKVEICRVLRAETPADAKKAVDLYCEELRPSHNPAAYLRAKIGEFKRERAKALLSQKKWKAPPDCVTPEEWESGAAVISEIMAHHRAGKAKSNPRGIGVSDIKCAEGQFVTEWDRLGRPATWSPLLDWWLSGYLQWCKAGDLVTYNKRCLELLRGQSGEAVNA